jgi:hypothetical protein
VSHDTRKPGPGGCFPHRQHTHTHTHTHTQTNTRARITPPQRYERLARGGDAAPAGGSDKQHAPGKAATAAGAGPGPDDPAGRPTPLANKENAENVAAGRG